MTFNSRGGAEGEPCGVTAHAHREQRTQRDTEEGGCVCVCVCVCVSLELRILCEAGHEAEETGLDCDQLTFFPELSEPLTSPTDTHTCAETHIILQELRDQEKVHTHTCIHTVHTHTHTHTNMSTCMKTLFTYKATHIQTHKNSHAHTHMISAHAVGGQS